MTGLQLLILISLLALAVAIVACLAAVAAQGRITALPKPPYMGVWPLPPGSLLDGRFTYSHLPVDGLPDGFEFPDGTRIDHLGSSVRARSGQRSTKYSIGTEDGEPTFGAGIASKFACECAIDRCTPAKCPHGDRASGSKTSGQHCVLHGVGKDVAEKSPTLEMPLRPGRPTPAHAGDGDLGEPRIDDPKTYLTIRDFSNGKLVIAVAHEVLLRSGAGNRAASGHPDRHYANSHGVTEQHPERVDDTERGAEQCQCKRDPIHGQFPEAGQQDSARGAA